LRVARRRQALSAVAEEGKSEGKSWANRCHCKLGRTRKENRHRFSPRKENRHRFSLRFPVKKESELTAASVTPASAQRPRAARQAAQASCQADVHPHRDCRGIPLPRYARTLPPHHRCLWPGSLRVGEQFSLRAVESEGDLRPTSGDLYPRTRPWRGGESGHPRRDAAEALVRAASLMRSQDDSISSEEFLDRPSGSDDRDGPTGRVWLMQVEGDAEGSARSWNRRDPASRPC